MSQIRKVEMRIIAGNYKRRKIYAPETPLVRPTKDRVREAIFSSLGDITNTSFLDLYAGSGAFGIEALSRGSKKAIFVDNYLPSINSIKENVRNLSIKEEYEIIYKKDIDALNIFKERNESFDIIFLDPPYEKGRYSEIISFINLNNLLNNNGIIIAESNYDIDVDASIFSKHKKYTYGEIIVNIYWR